MPVRPREMNDQPTEARIQQVIRYLLDQEVRRINVSTAALEADIAANAAAILQNAADIDDNDRRDAARNVDGIVTYPETAGGGGTSVSVVETPFSSTQSWTATIANHPIQVTLWSRTTFTSDASFDTFAFDAVSFDQAEEVLGINTTATVTYKPSSSAFAIDWGSAKSGTLYLINTDSGTAFAVVAVAD